MAICNCAETGAKEPDAKLSIVKEARLACTERMGKKGF